MRDERQTDDLGTVGGVEGNGPDAVRLEWS